MTSITRTRGQQRKPTRAELDAAWERLRAAAKSGDTLANAALIALQAADRAQDREHQT